MLPNTQKREYEHRREKRELEAQLIIEAIERYLRTRPQPNRITGAKIFEFGAGDGLQIPYLRRLGNVISSDIYTSERILREKPVQFVECSVTDTPFRNAEFDVIFANHVIAHLMDISAGLREVQRIGKPSCLYAFAVPTAVWLLLSLPALYYNKLRYGVTLYQQDSKLKKFMRVVLPEGNGRWNFLKCWYQYRTVNWRRLFIAHGFSVVEILPLLFYGPSEWPFIRTSPAGKTFFSSVLFLLTKRSSPG